MPFYVPVGLRGVLFQAGTIWTGGMGSLIYWWTNRRGTTIPVPRASPRAIPVDPALDDRAGQRPSLAVERASIGPFSGIEPMSTDDAMGDELERVRAACVDLGADEEMTALVLASHRHDRTLLDVMAVSGEGLRDYARHKLAIWEAILDEDDELFRRAAGTTVKLRDIAPSFQYHHESRNLR